MNSFEKKINKFEFVMAFERLLIRYSNSYLDYLEELKKPFTKRNPCIIRRYVYFKDRIAKFELFLHRNLPSSIEVD